MHSTANNDFTRYVGATFGALLATLRLIRWHRVGARQRPLSGLIEASRRMSASGYKQTYRGRLVNVRFTPNSGHSEAVLFNWRRGPFSKSPGVMGRLLCGALGGGCCSRPVALREHGLRPRMGLHSQMLTGPASVGAFFMFEIRA